MHAYFVRALYLPRKNSEIWSDNRACSIKRNTYLYLNIQIYSPSVYSLFNVETCWTHNNCACNELIALKFRHQVKTPVFAAWKPPINIFTIFDTTMLTYEKFFKTVTLMSRYDVVNHYHGSQRAKMVHALNILNHRTLNKNDFILTMFVKAGKETEYVTKACRAIQYRKATSCLEMARFTIPIEREIYKIRDKFGTLVFGKGASSRVIGHEFLLKTQQFVNPCYVMLDASKFDAHIDISLLNYISELYQKFCITSKHRNYVAWLWGHTMGNKGFTRNGVGYCTLGTRMSGDMDTGLGNCILMQQMLEAYCLFCKVSHYSMMVNGDDSVLIVELDDFPKLVKGFGFWLEMGFKMKFEYTMDLTKVEFCQAYLMQWNHTAAWVYPPDKVLTKFGTTVEMLSKRGVRDYIYTLCMGEMAWSWGTPMAVWAYNLMQKLERTGKCGLNRLSRRMWKVLSMEENWLNKERPYDAEMTNAYINLFSLSTEQVQSLLNVHHGAITSGYTDKQYSDYRYRINI